MTIITITYLAVLYLVFGKFKWLPWNRLTRLLSIGVGVCVLTWFLTVYKNLTPTSVQAFTWARVVDIAPQVPGEVISVDVGMEEDVEQGDVLFQIDPTLFQAQVKQLEAGLRLATLRLGQFQQLAASEAVSRFSVEQTEAEIEGLEAQLKAARFNLTNATVRAPFAGRIPKNVLKPGVQVAPGRTVFGLVDTANVMVAALIPQRALPNMKVGDPAMIHFLALPGKVFKAEVAEIQTAIGEGRFVAQGMDMVSQRRMVRVFPVILTLPDDFPPELRKLGLAAKVTVVTENAGIIGKYAAIAQWISTSLDAIL